MKKFLAGLIVGGLVAISGVAVASIPDGSGVIHGCIKSNNMVKIIDSATQSCASGETPITWNQTGPQGPAGSDGGVNESQVQFGTLKGDRTEYSTNGIRSATDTSGTLTGLNPFDAVRITGSAGASYKLYGSLQSPPDGTACVRLYDYTVDEAVAGSATCYTSPADGSQGAVFFETSAFSLASAEHTYAIQTKDDLADYANGEPAGGASARLLVDVAS